MTDPPYGLGFMGKKWDTLPPGPETAEMSGVSKNQPRRPRKDGVLGHGGSSTPFCRGSEVSALSDVGGASRFFYCAKASRSERNAGCEGLEGMAR